jgi:hypothetical protein
LGCAIKHRCTTAKERRITRWEHEHILEAVQRRLDEHPERMRQRAGVNAIVDALSVLGIKHIDTPCTPFKVWQATRIRRRKAYNRYLFRVDSR